MLQVITYNIHKGLNTWGFKHVLKQMKQMLVETKVDICLLQEVEGQNSTRETEVQFEFLADTVWTYYSYGQNATFPSRHHGNAILSRFPILEQSNHSLTLHSLEQRGFQHCVIGLPDFPDREIKENKLHIINTHLNLRNKDRLVQIQKILDHIEKNIPAHEPFILGGDFNDWNLQVAKTIEQRLSIQDSHQFLHKTVAKTFPSFLPLASLDRLYFRHLKPHKAEVLKEQGWSNLSDHAPLRVFFEI